MLSLPKAGYVQLCTLERVSHSRWNPNLGGLYDEAKATPSPAVHKYSDFEMDSRGPDPVHDRWRDLGGSYATGFMTAIGCTHDSISA